MAAALIGKPITIAGLVAKPELNGRRGVVLSFDAERGRYHVRVDQSREVVALKPDNLEGLLLNVVDGFQVPSTTAVAGNASPWAIERMRMVITRHETLLGVWQIPEEARCSMAKQRCATMAIPLLWPAAVCCAPCVCSTCEALNDVNAGTTYVLTDHVRRAKPNNRCATLQT